MAMHTVSDLNTLRLTGSSYYYFIVARYFAGLFCRASKPILSRA